MKNTRVDSTAIIYPCAKIGEGAIIEPFCIVGIPDRFQEEKPCIIGNASFLGSRVTIYSGVVTGDQFDVSDQTTIFFDNIFGHNCRIGPKAVVKNGCRFGNNVRLNAQVFVERVEIGSQVFIGPGTVFTDDLHPPCPRYSDCAQKTQVESWVSIGANVTITPGVTIGHHSQIYAGSVVLEDVAPHSVIAGNPGRLVKDFRELQCKAGLYVRPFVWWESD